MKGKSYTFFIASNMPGGFRKIRVPAYVLHAVAVLAVIGGMTIIIAAGSYSRMLWKVGNYNALRHEQDTLKKQYQQLQSTVNDTNQRLDSLQSLATEVAMTYGVLRFRPAPFQVTDLPQTPEAEFELSVEQFNFLKKNAAALAISNGGLRITGSFGERLDPFSGEGAFHTGVDISSQYGEAIHAAADGVVTIAESHAGYGRLVVVDHGFGITSWYGHLSAFATVAGTRVKRGQVVGYAGISGRATGPHVHYEVRLNNAPVNPWRYLRSNTGSNTTSN